MLLISAAKSQTSYYPWLIGISTDYVDFHVVDRNFANFVDKADWMGSNFPSGVRFGRQINKSFTMNFLASYFRLESAKLNTLPFEENLLKNDSWKGSLQANYNFANGYLLSVKSIVNPYLSLGIGATLFNNDPFFVQTTGIGTEISVFKNLAINLQASYNYLPQINDYMHYSMGIFLKVGKTDSDRDGVSDKKDFCPEIPGLETFSGCPDYDADGIPDHLDQCPRDFGFIDTKGCPDKDRDGVSDPFDRCPEIAGSQDCNGCPDSDKDGIMDADDECPSVYGSVRNKGCPEFISTNQQQPPVTGEAAVKADSIIAEDTASKLPETIPAPVVQTQVEPTKSKQDSNVQTSRKTAEVPVKYLIIAGSFREMENARKLISDYQAKGYNPELSNIDDKGFYTVVISSFVDFDRALNFLTTIKTSINPDAWILPVY